MKKLRTGLWFVRNQGVFSNIINGLLLCFCIITWGLFVFYFGEYIALGLFQEKALLNTKVATRIIDHNYFVNKSAFPIEVSEVESIKTNVNHTDLYAKVGNPNKDFIVEFDYYFEVNGENIFQEKGFIFPNEIKYLIALNQEVESVNTSVDLRIINIKWKRVDPHLIPDWKLFNDNRLGELNVNDITFQLANTTGLSEKINLNKLSFLIDNKTAYNYLDVKFDIILFRKNKVVGVNQYIVDKLPSSEEKAVEMIWPGNFGHINSFLVVPDVDILNEKSYYNFVGGIGELK